MAEQRRTEIHASLLNYFVRSVLYTLGWPVHAFIDTVKQAGYAGIEWHPLRQGLAALQMYTGLLKSRDPEGITSLHQSYREQKNLEQVWNHKNRKLAALSYVLLPERTESLHDLAEIQRHLGKQLPAVLYPSEPWEESGTHRPFAEKLFQPTPQIMHKWDVASVAELIEEAKKRGYTGFCLDLFHMRSTPVLGKTLGPWQETLPQLLAFTKEIHVSAGRVDQQQKHIPTQQELMELLIGKGESEMMRMLTMINSLKWKGRVVTETPAEAIHILRPNRTRFSSPEQVICDHAAIVKTLQTVLA